MSRFGPPAGTEVVAIHPMPKKYRHPHNLAMERWGADLRMLADPQMVLDNNATASRLGTVEQELGDVKQKLGAVQKKLGNVEGELRSVREERQAEAEARQAEAEARQAEAEARQADAEARQAEKDAREAEDEYHEYTCVTFEVLSALERVILSRIFGRTYHSKGVTMLDIIEPFDNDRAAQRDNGWPALKVEYEIDKRFGDELDFLDFLGGMKQERNIVQHDFKPDLPIAGLRDIMVAYCTERYRRREQKIDRARLYAAATKEEARRKLRAERDWYMKRIPEVMKLVQAALGEQPFARIVPGDNRNRNRR